jgi:hypothetical protein
MVWSACAHISWRNMASAYRAPRTVFPGATSGLRKPIAIQAAINFNMNLAE